MIGSRAIKAVAMPDRFPLRHVLPSDEGLAVTVGGLNASPRVRRRDYRGGARGRKSAEARNVMDNPGWCQFCWPQLRRPLVLLVLGDANRYRQSAWAGWLADWSRSPDAIRWRELLREVFAGSKLFSKSATTETRLVQARAVIVYADQDAVNSVLPGRG